MRVWDLPPNILCRNHLLGEHNEIHAIWNVITKNKKGYSSHPETKRWIGKLKALYLRHSLIVIEMQNRGYKHKSTLDKKLSTGKSMQDQFVNSITEQKNILRSKNCLCFKNTS